MENFQLDFLATTAAIWNSTFPFTGDALYQWSRQWEYPYARTNLGVSHGKILEAGSGLTVFPFLLAQQGYQVFCCDNSAILEESFQVAQQGTRLPVQFECASITRLAQPDDFFDAVCCLSVLEHMSSNERRMTIREFARVLRPGGRLIVTCDISLGRDTDIRLEDSALRANLRNLLRRRVGRTEFHALAVIGLTLVKPQRAAA